MLNWKSHSDRSAGPPTKALASVQIDAGSVAKYLFAATAAVWSLGLAQAIWTEFFGGKFFMLVDRFNLDGEGNVGAWYSSLLLASAALVIFLLCRESKRSAPGNVMHWGILAAAFLYLSADEAIGLHEIPSAILREELQLTGALVFGWVLIAIPVLIFMGIFYLPFLMRLPRRFMIALIACGAIYVFGALGLEMIGGTFHTQSTKTMAYKLMVSAEEGCEMLGLTLFLVVLLRHLASYSRSVAGSQLTRDLPMPETRSYATSQ